MAGWGIYGGQPDPQDQMQQSAEERAQARTVADPQYQYGQYKVRQANRTPVQKGTDAGTALRALQESSGLNLLGSSSGWGGAGGTGGGGGTPPPTVHMPDTTAANAAIFARAKDQAGETARAALTGLRGQLAGRGLLGSGIEGGETARIVGKAAGSAQEITREQAIQDAANLAALAGKQYAGGIEQRGQDIDLLKAREAAAAAQRSKMLEGLLGVINSEGIIY